VTALETGAFSQLNNRVAKLAVSRFSRPTPVQQLVIPRVLAGKNILMTAPAGIGKTEAGMLPLFSKLIETEHRPIALLYITPLRSLNRDLFDRLLWWCNKLELDTAVRHGDTTAHERRLQVEHPPHLLITTPEQIQAMLTGRNLRRHLKNIRYVIVDEIHEIVESKRGVQLAVALERLKQLCGQPQIIALSATVGSPETAARFIFAGSDFEIIRADTEKALDLRVESPFPTRADRALAEKIFIGNGVAARLRRIHELMRSHKAVLAFTNTREAAEILSSRLRAIDRGFPYDVHHSSLSKEVRVKAEREFKSGRLKSLICTSSLELGIDIGAIDAVLQYMSPRQVTAIVQRAGRSGHSIGRRSKGIIITTEADDIFEAAVIARRALSGQLEPLRPHQRSLDVLAHQIIGLAGDNFRISPKSAYEIIKRAWPYQKLSKKEFLEVLRFLGQLNMAWTEAGIKRGRRALQYYFENLSVIPEQRSYRVIDITANIPVGRLDEEFVAEHNEVGATFIVKGKPWRIVSVEQDKIFVEPTGDIESAIPAWEGELIPVPFAVAQGVGMLRAEIARMLNKGLRPAAVANQLKQRYPVSGQAAAKMISLIKKQVKKWPVPDDRTLLIENYAEYTVLHAPFGSLVNETLSRFIAALLSAEYGEVIASRCDPYRIIFRGCSVEDIKKILFGHKPADIEVILEKALPRSSLFKWRFLHVAKRFGAIRRDAEFSKIRLNKLIELYFGSPIHTETLRELFTEKLDLEKAAAVLRDIQLGKIKIIETRGLSPIAELGLKYELHDVALPSRPEKEIFRIFKSRLLHTRVRLLCVNCGKYSVAKYVKDVEPEPRCSLCHSRLLAVVHPHRTEALTIIKKRLLGKDLTAEELKALEQIKRSADLTIVYGSKAVVCLAGRGIGPQTAARLLARMHRTDEDFYKDILKAEREFIRTKRYWSN
jgi:ATP-dependent Lhr-like helicase